MALLRLRLWTGPRARQLRQDWVPAARERPPEGARASSVAAGCARSLWRECGGMEGTDGGTEGGMEASSPSQPLPRFPVPWQRRLCRSKVVWRVRAPASPRGMVHASVVQA